MALKYQNEIDGLNLNINCPNEVIEPDNVLAYRWSYIPVQHPMNFVPNIVFDRLNNSSVNYAKLDNAKKCSRCGVSFYTSLEIAKSVWNSLNETLGEKLKLDYTHISSGVLTRGDGYMKVPKNGHFGFYENVDVEIENKFTTIDTIR